MKRSAMLFALCLLCAACAAPTQPAPTLPVPPTAPVMVASLTSLASPTATATPLPTATPAPTATALPTATSSPTPTPTLALPVTLGTALPELQPITAESFAQVSLVGDYRRLPEAAQRTVLSGDGGTFFTVTADGIDVYASAGPELIGRLDIPVMRPLTGQVYMPESPGIRPLSLLLQPSADGRRLMVARARGADVFTVRGDKLFSYDTPAEFPWESYGYAFSPDGRLLAVELCSAGCYSKNPTYTPNFTVYDVDTGQPVYQWNGGNGGDVHGASPIFSPDGKILSTYIGGVIFLWDTATWEKITTFPAKGSWTPERMVYFSPDARFLALCDTERVMLWQLDGRKMTRTWPVSMGQAIFSPDNSKIGVLRYQTLTVYDRETGAALAEQDFSAAGLPATLLQNDGSLVFSAPPAEPTVLPAPWLADLNADALSFDLSIPAGRLRISPRFEDETCVWQPAGAAECLGVRTIPGTDGRRYVRKYDQAAQVFTIHAEDGEELARIPAQQYFSVGEEIAFDPSRKFLFYSHRNGGGGMADLSRGWLNVLARWPKSPASSAISPDGKYLALELRADPNVQLLIYDIELHAMIYDRPFLFGASGMAFSADSSTLMHLLDQPGREKIQRLTLLRMDDRNRPAYVPIEAPWTALPKRFQFAPDGDLLYSVSNGDLCWLNLPEGGAASCMDPFPDDNLAHAFALSPDGKLLGVFFLGELKVYGIP